MTLSSIKPPIPIEQIEPPTFKQFHHDYALRGQPVVIRGAIEHWKALTKWDDNYLKDRTGSISLPVARSNSGVFGDVPEIAPGNDFVMRRFDAFIDSLASRGRATTDYAAVAQVNLFRSLGPLSEDVEVPHYIDRAALHTVNIWIAPPRAISWLHYDPYHNLYACVRGSKKVVLIAPRYLRQLYPHPWYSPQCHHSRVRIDEPDLERFPRYAEVERLETILNPGDMLFIPINWWHQIYGLDTSIFVNFFWHVPIRQFLAYPQLQNFRYLKPLLLSRLLFTLRSHR